MLTDKTQDSEMRSYYQKSQKFGYCEFEIDPFDNTLHGDIVAYVYEGGQAEGQHDAKAIVSGDESLYVKVKWRLWGHLAKHLCGYFCVCVYLERHGPGDDIVLDCDKDIEMKPCGDGYYEFVCEIPRDEVAWDDCGSLYDVSVSLTSLNMCKEPGHIAAFCKGPTVMFYKTPDSQGNGG